MKRGRFFIKVCGITSVRDAMACVDAGVDALGCVFYPPSPRNVTPDIARAIRSETPANISLFGVFVNEEPDRILKIRDAVGFDVAQLHGYEPPESVSILQKEGLKVCKALFSKRKPFFQDVSSYPCDMFLLEAGQSGPGGTGREWAWGEAKETVEKLITRGAFVLIAGGVNPENAVSVIRAVMPSGIDVSSGVELAPGVKDEKKVRTLVQNVRGVFHESFERSTG